MRPFVYLLILFFCIIPLLKSDKVILDNDWSGSASFIPLLLMLDSNVDVLGLTVVVGNSWLDHMTMHVLRFLELGNLTKQIPVYKGAMYPLLNTPYRMDIWQKLYGKIPWTGAFAQRNLAEETLGLDPTGGDPTRILTSGLPEGLPSIARAQSMSAINFLIEQVHTYPGEVSILAAGPLTNIALAIRMNSTFSRNVKKIVIQGGYYDINYAQVGENFDTSQKY